MKRILVVYVFMAIVSGLLFLGFSNYTIGATEGNLLLHSEILNLENGYGYQIKLDNRVLIRQEYIPVLPGKKPFATAEDAQRAADKIIRKLQNKEDPILTFSELKELEIPEFNIY
ncbi:DUF4907 domain-containing protein [Arenibacter sp. ARW7G5Y1]|uniref:DUF4907 domain-containing protein n=1 Tax=Arenibacter sp. ARW7G5Y1 TaxID=2135619 RepID=UPI000D762CCC|nr:DUF4907 domain-containing protein [Arenibacter sp. ARW7G5Y1]PXX22347.1 uncharacterized protein DUF4907 [Arenibacter sp. ARW7G5Y1]